MSTVTIPAGDLAGELEFAIAYTVACNPGRDLLGTDRKLFAEALAGMLIERARNRQPGASTGSGPAADERDDAG